MRQVIRFIQRFAFLLLMGILFLLLLLAVAFGQTPEQARQSLQLLEREQSSKALAFIEQGVGEEGSSTGLFYRGYIHVKAGDLEKASHFFKEGAGANEKDPLNHAGLGYVFMLQGKTGEAKLSFEKALGLSKSKNTLVLKTVAEGYLSNAVNVAEAISLLERAHELDNTDAETVILLGDAFLAQNNGGLAVSSYERAAKTDPKNPAPHYKIAMVYIRSKNYQAAKEALNTAISVDPSYTLAYKELGKLYYLTKEGEKAVEAQEAYLRLTEKTEEGQLQYAFYLFMAKKYTKANEIFSELVKKENVTATTYRFYAKSLMESADTTSAVRMFEHYFSNAKPEEIEASDYSYYANILKDLGKDSLAVLNFQKSLALDRSQPEVMQRIADIQYKNKNYPEAIKFYQLLIENRTEPMAQDFYNIGRAYYFNSEFNHADSAFTRLIELQPNHPAGYLWAGRSRANLDPETEQGLAKDAYEKLIEVASKTPEKSKNDLIEAYSYLGYYHFLKEERQLSRSYWEKVLALNPENLKAKEALKALQ